MVEMNKIVKPNGVIIYLPFAVEVDETKSQLEICYDIISELSDELEGYLNN